MDPIDAINTVGRETFKTTFAWVRYITGLATGSFTILIAFFDKLKPEPLWAMQTAWILLFLTVCLGCFLLFREVRLSQRSLVRLADLYEHREYEMNSAKLISIPVLKKFDYVFIAVFFLSFLTSFGMLLVLALNLSIIHN